VQAWYLYIQTTIFGHYKNIINCFTNSIDIKARACGQLKSKKNKAMRGRHIPKVIRRLVNYSCLALCFEHKIQMHTVKSTRSRINYSGYTVSRLGHQIYTYIVYIIQCKYRFNFFNITKMHNVLRILNLNIIKMK